MFVEVVVKFGYEMVLVVEDEVMVCVLMWMIFECYGYCVLVVGNGFEVFVVWVEYY